MDSEILLNFPGLDHVGTGNLMVWGINGKEIVVRTGITPMEPKGTEWATVLSPANATASKIAVSDVDDTVWLTDSDGEIYFRQSVSHANRVGTHWESQSGDSVAGISSLQAA